MATKTMTLGNSSTTVNLTANGTVVGSNIKSKGSATQPVFFDANGVAQPTTYALNSAVPANAKFTDTTYSAGTGISLSGTTFSVNPNVSTKEAYIQWGGKNFESAYGPIDAALVSTLGANRLELLKAEGILVEYSKDGGATWIDYEQTDKAKRELFSSIGNGVYIGKCTATDKATTNPGQYKVRMTLTTNLAGVYTVLNKFVILVSTNGSAGCKCTITGRTKANLDANNETWVTFADKIPVSGWSGYNVINTSGITTYGNTTSQYANLRFLFEDDETKVQNTNYNGLQVISIMGFGGVGWATPTTIAKTGHLYSYNGDLNATFPANITATGTIVGTNIKSKGSSKQPVYFDSNGNATAISYTIEKSVPSDAKFTDTNTTYSAGDGLTLTGTKFEVTQDDASVIVNKLGTGSSTPTDADYYISQYVGGGTTTTSYHRRPHSALWEYIKSKISSVLGLTATNYNGKASTATISDKTKALYYCDGTGTAAITSSPYTFAKWEASIPEITELVDGLTISYKVPVVGNGSYGTCLQINNLGYHPVLRRATNMISDRYPAGSTILLTYVSNISGTIYNNSASSSTIDGCFVVTNDHDSTDTDYNYRDYYLRIKAGVPLYRYKICGIDSNNSVQPLVITNQTDTTMVAKQTNTNSFRASMGLYYYNSTTTRAANEMLGGQSLYKGFSTSNMHRYTFNSTLPAYTVVYIKGTYNRDADTFTLPASSSTDWYVSVPTNQATINYSSYFENGSYYMLVGYVYSSNGYFTLSLDNDVYYYDGTNLTLADNMLPIGTNTTLGILRAGETGGIGASNGGLFIRAASTTEIDAKTNNQKPIVPSTLEYAVKSVGVPTDVKINDVSIITDGVANIPIASTSQHGIVKTNASFGTSVNSSSGVLVSTTRTLEQYGSDGSSLFISKGTLENIKESIISSVTYTKKQLDNFNLFNKEDLIHGKVHALATGILSDKANHSTIIVPFDSTIGPRLRSSQRPERVALLDANQVALQKFAPNYISNNSYSVIPDSDCYYAAFSYSDETTDYDTLMIAYSNETSGSTSDRWNELFGQFGYVEYGLNATAGISLNLMNKIKEIDNKIGAIDTLIGTGVI